MSSFSSNAFANGNNQNCGNFISDRPTTKLHAPPGGSSTAGSLIFGGGSSNYTEVGVSSNRYANGSNQNCGNVMTGRSSTRLHAPPGGSSSQAGSRSSVVDTNPRSQAPSTTKNKASNATCNYTYSKCASCQRYH